MTGYKRDIKWMFSPKKGTPTFAMRLIKVEVGGIIPEHPAHGNTRSSSSGRVRGVVENTSQVSEGNAVLVPSSLTQEYYLSTGR
ncbi:MAG: hypothetical protein NZ992_03525 [Candidatus Korarchaeum sp.]|nr:hypothetical protein [Candidatus Korarchaeum sp.]MDW8035487.1 hypothetical protein [Candidatus Korarchaeum sp.]